MAMDDVNPVPDLDPSDQRQCFVGGEIEWVQGKPEIGMLNKGEEAESAVLYPLQDNAFLSVDHFGFHERGEFSQRTDLITCHLKLFPVGLPGSEHGFTGVMEKIHIAGDTGGFH